MRSRLPPAAILVISLLVPLLQWIPNWQAYRAASPPDRVFLGFRYMAGDHYQYAAFIRQAREDGRLLMENRFTTEPQRGVFVLAYFWLLGVSSKLTGLGLVATWEVFRFIGGALYILAFWAFSATWFPERNRRALATVIFAFAGGLDWIVTLLRFAGLDWLAPLSYPYDYYWNWCTFGAMVVPNWIWPAMLLMLAAHFAASGARRRDVVTFLALPCVWFLHAYSGMVAYLAFGLLPLAPIIVEMAQGRAPAWGRARANLRLAAPGLLSFVPVAAYLLWARTDEVFRLNSATGFSWKDNFSVWWYPLSYGLLLPLAWFGLGALLRKGSRAADILVSWLAAAFFLSVNPLYAGVKFQYLLFPPLAVFAAAGLFHLWDSYGGFRRVIAAKPLMAGCLLGLFLNAPLSLAKDFPLAAGQQELFLSRSQIEAMRWLDQQPDGVVLCGYRTGNLVPWLAGKKVYYGHWFLTLNTQAKRQQISYFFSPSVSLQVKREILSRSGARYVFFGPAEAAGGQIDPALPLEKIYDQEDVRIYQVHGVR